MAARAKSYDHSFAKVIALLPVVLVIIVTASVFSPCHASNLQETTFPEQIAEQQKPLEQQDETSNRHSNALILFRNLMGALTKLSKGQTQGPGASSPSRRDLVAGPNYSCTVAGRACSATCSSAYKTVQDVSTGLQVIRKGGVPRATCIQACVELKKMVTTAATKLAAGGCKANVQALHWVAILKQLTAQCLILASKCR